MTGPPPVSEMPSEQEIALLLRAGIAVRCPNCEDVNHKSRKHCITCGYILK